MPLQRLDLTPTSNPLAESLGRGLESLTQHKMSQLQRSFEAQNTARGLEALGFPQQQANAYAHLDPRLLQQIVHQKVQEPSQMAFAQGLQSLLGGETPPAIQQQSPLSQNENQIQRPVHSQANQPQSHSQPFPQVKQFQENTPSLSGRLNPQQAYQLAQLGIQKQMINKKDEKEQRRIDQKLAADFQKQADKETLPFYNEVITKDKAAKLTDNSVNRMLHLIDKGKLPDPVYYKQLKDLEEHITPIKGAGALGTVGAGVGTVLGGPVGGALGGIAGTLLGAAVNPLITAARYGQLKKYPDTEEFEKLSNGFISGAKSVFGARITDLDLRSFMATVPQLSNTEYGKKAIIHNIKILNEASHLELKALKDIIKENGGHRPTDIALQVSERVKPQLDTLSSQFINNAHKAELDLKLKEDRDKPYRGVFV